MKNPNFYNAFFADDQQQREVLNRIAHAVFASAISLDETLKAAEFIAACASYGLPPRDVLYDGIKAYPHLMEMMGVAWDVAPIAGDLPDDQREWRSHDEAPFDPDKTQPIYTEDGTPHEWKAEEDGSW